MRHAACEIKDFGRTALDTEALRVDIGIMRIDPIVAHRPLCKTEFRTLHSNLADCGAFSAHQAFVAYFFYSLFVSAPQLPVKINGTILQVLLAHAHGTGVYAYSAARAGVELHPCETFSRMQDMKACIAKGYQQHFGRNVHVTGERQHRHEHAQRDGVGPPGRQRIQLVAKELPENPVHRERKKTSAADMGGEALAKQTQREDSPQRIQPHPVEETRIRGPSHADDTRPHPLDDGQHYAAQYHQQEEVHQEKEHGTLKRRLRLRDEVIEEDGVIEQMYPLRQEKHHFQMSQQYYHEPPEGYAGMHIAQHRIAFPQLDVDQAVEKNILDVLKKRFRGDEGQKELSAVRLGKLDKYPDHAEKAVGQHENHPEHEGDDKGVETACEPFSHSSPSLLP